MWNWLRRLCACAGAGALVFVSCSVFSVRAADASGAQTPQLLSAAAIVADADSGQIYYQKDMHAKMYPASITKILTGLVAAEHSQPSDNVTITDTVTKAQRSDMANIALKPGDTLTIEQLQYALFVASANDAALAIAEHVGGTVDGFLSMMNAKATELGTVDSHFSTPNGLPDANNYTSAYDMALIAQAALQNTTVLQYFSTPSYIIQPSGLRTGPIYLVAKHKMRQKASVYYDADVFAGKTGWEAMSGNTLVTVAKQNGRTLIAVVLKGDSASDTYQDTRALFNYAFAQPANTQAEALPYLSIRQAKAAAASQAAEQARLAVAAKAEKTKQPAETAGAIFILKEHALPASLATGCVIAFFIVFNRLVRRRIQSDRMTG